MSEKSPAAAPVTEPEFAAFVAIDWADQKHYWRLVAAGSDASAKVEACSTPDNARIPKAF